ncbi:MAG: hypothetical protein ACI8ZM_001003 [Crocinitomix sp.]|jgi:hypothetical protein
MKLVQITLFLALIFSFNSCRTIKNSTTKENDVAGPTVIQKPVIADLDVKETKVTGTFSGTSNFSMSYAKNMAIADALKSANADVLIEPRFETIKSFRRIDVTVTGYPATYKNFRPMEAADTIFVNTVKPTKDIQLFDNGGGRNVGKIALISGGSLVAAGGLFFLWLLLF